MAPLSNHHILLVQNYQTEHLMKFKAWYPSTFKYDLKKVSWSEKRNINNNKRSPVVLKKQKKQSNIAKLF